MIKFVVNLQSGIIPILMLRNFPLQESDLINIICSLRIKWVQHIYPKYLFSRLLKSHSDN